MNFKFAGYRIIGYFLLLAVLILLAAGLSLLMPGTFWKQIWFIKKAEYQKMLPNRLWIGWGFWLLAIIMAIAVTGWFRKRRWGWFLVIAIFMINGLSDAVRFVMGNYIEGSIGVCTTAGIVFYLLRSSVKNFFS